MKNLTKKIYHWHQKLGLFFGLAIIFWGLSGLAHPIISRLNPKPIAFSAPQIPLYESETNAIIEPSDILSRYGVESVTRARVFRALSEPENLLLRVEVPTTHPTAVATPRYYSLLSGSQKAPEYDSDYATALARHYTGDHHSLVASVKKITEYTDDYHYINRILPIWQVEFDRPDGLRAYVDTDSGRLGTLSNNRKYILGSAFRLLHSWTFIENDKIRIALMSLCLIIGFLISSAGLFLYLQYWRKGVLKNSKKLAPSRRLHRGSGALVSIAAIGFCLSGLWHALHKWPSSSTDIHSVAAASEAVNQQWRPNIKSANLGLDLKAIDRTLDKPVINLQAVSTADQTAWLAQQKNTGKRPALHDHHAKKDRNHKPAFDYFSPSTAKPLSNFERIHALNIASEITGLPVSTLTEKINQVDVIRKFGGEYGFVNKRLPVIKLALQGPQQPTLYIETRSQTLASFVTNSDRFEGLSFAYIHKWHHLDFLGKNTRDSLLGFFALLTAFAFGMGLYRYYCIKTKAKVNNRRNDQSTETTASKSSI